MWGRSATPPPERPCYYSASDAKNMAQEQADAYQQRKVCEMFDSIRYKAKIGGTHTIFIRTELPKNYTRILQDAGYEVKESEAYYSQYVTVRWLKQES